MRIQVVRHGGVAGLTLQATIETSQLSGTDSTTVEAGLRTLPWGRPAPPLQHPDQFHYEITELQPHGGRSVGLREDELPPQLQPLLKAFEVRKQLRRH